MKNSGSASISSFTLCLLFLSCFPCAELQKPELLIVRGVKSACSKALEFDPCRSDSALERDGNLSILTGKFHGEKTWRAAVMGLGWTTWATSLMQMGLQSCHLFILSHYKKKDWKGLG